MKRTLGAIAFSVLVIILVGTQQAFATLIDFDTFPDGTVPPDSTRITVQYEPCGVSLFTTDDPDGPEIRSFSSSSPPNLLAPTGLRFQFTGFIGIEFSSPVSGDVSVFGIEVRHGGLRLQAFNSADALIATSEIPVSSVTRSETMTVNGIDIVKLVITQIIPQTGGFVDGYAIDDLEFPGPPCEIQEDEVIQEDVVGGKLLPIDTTALLLAGIQTNLAWIVPLVLAGTGFAAYRLGRS